MKVRNKVLYFSVAVKSGLLTNVELYNVNNRLKYNKIKLVSNTIKKKLTTSLQISELSVRGFIFQGPVR